MYRTALLSTGFKLPHVLAVSELRVVCDTTIQNNFVQTVILFVLIEFVVERLPEKPFLSVAPLGSIIR